MEQEGEGDDTPRQTDDLDAENQTQETYTLVRTGPRAGNRAGGLAFLALMVVIGAALHFHLSAGGGDAFLSRLDSELLAHAKLSLAATEEGVRLATVPSWPLRLYSTLRRDIAVYALFLAAAAYLWGVSARARACRDAFLVHEKLAAEVRELRHRIDVLENGPAAAPNAEQQNEKG